MLVLVMLDPVGTVSSNSFLPELLTGGAQLQAQQQGQGKSRMGCWKHQSEMKALHTMLFQRRRSRATPR